MLENVYEGLNARKCKGRSNQKNEPVWRIVKTAYSLFWIDVLKIYIIYVLKIDIILHYFIWNLDINVEIIGAMFFYLS